MNAKIIIIMSFKPFIIFLRHIISEMSTIKNLMYVTLYCYQVIKNIFYKIWVYLLRSKNSGLRGATVARSTPDRKVACSNHVGVKFFLVFQFFKYIIKFFKRKRFFSWIEIFILAVIDHGLYINVKQIKTLNLVIDFIAL